MGTNGLTLVMARDQGGSTVTGFGIVVGREREAAQCLLGYLEEDSTEVCLSNDRDEGGEGCTLFRRSSGYYITKEAGHGWQGEWKTVDRAYVLDAISRLADVNRGDRADRCGFVVRPKS